MTTAQVSWRPPLYRPEGRALSAEDVAALRESARLQGHEQGLREGRAAAQAELKAQMESIGRALEDLEAARARMTQDHHQRLLEVLALAFRHLFLHQLQVSDLDEALVRQAMQGLQLEPNSQPPARLIVDPLTAAQLGTLEDPRFSIEPDATLSDIELRLDTPQQTWASLPEQELLNLLQSHSVDELLGTTDP